MINPYADIDWDNIETIQSMSHGHSVSDKLLFDRFYNGGARHIALSNYYPSKPYYPLTDFFVDVPTDVIGSPNAEHHNLSNWYGHYNGLGSMFASDSKENETPFTWQYMVDNVKEKLIYTDGGGLTINHPSVTTATITNEMIFSMLDYDEIVLGIEVFNDSADVMGQGGLAFDKWDEILKTGRRCWGFFVPDWSHLTQYRAENWQGKNILLVGDKTEHACLKAYRDGAFFGSLLGSDLTFTNIEVVDNTLTVNTNSAETITFITDKGKVKTVSGTNGTYDILFDDVFVRVEAYNNGDSIFSQPITLKDKNEIKRKKIIKRLLL